MHEGPRGYKDLGLLIVSGGIIIIVIMYHSCPYWLRNMDIGCPITGKKWFGFVKSYVQGQ